MIISYPQKKLCPYLLEPFENCYCARMDSQDIERAVNLCSYNFEICDIYKKNNGNGNGNGNGHKKVNGGNGSRHAMS
ncbi:MAG: hypothetical protein HZA16_13670 [Nitrospirae bacterium]|nr:hypothetical protein [Nitrospirota bacterium]